MWAELRDGGLVDLDNGNTISINKYMEEYVVNFLPNDITLFSGSKEDCKKVLYRLSKKLGAIDITDLLYDDVSWNPLEGLRNMRRLSDENNNNL